jgi:nitrate reductase NapAB chaperone NapD
MLDGCAAAIAGLDGADVYLRDERSGRLIAVLESVTADGQEALVRRIRDIAGVHAAALVYHYVDPGEPAPASGEGS